jgi:translation initiation factor 1
MSKKKKKGIVYSTNPDFHYQYESDPEVETLPPGQQDLRVGLERKGRGGKTATIVTGFVGGKTDLEDLARSLKNKCATGGSVKEGEIIMQGDCRDKVISVLDEKGYRSKKSGG